MAEGQTLTVNAFIWFQAYSLGWTGLPGAP